MTELAALNVKITGDSSDLQSDVSQVSTQLNNLGKSADTAGKRTTAFSGSMSRLSNVSAQTRARIQNTSFQLQDIAVQLQGGTRASTVFAQQLPQLLGGFGAVGAAAGVLAGIGIPALALAFQSIGPAAYDFDEALNSVKDSIDEVEASMKLLSMSADEAKIQFGAAAETILGFAVFQAELRIAQATGRLREQASAVREVANEYIVAAREGPLLNKIIREFGIEGENAGEVARALRQELINVANATGFEQQKAALQSLQEFLDNAGISAGTIPPELARAISEAITLNAEMATLAQLLERAAAASGQIGMTYGTPLGLDGEGGKGLLPPARTPRGGGRGGGRRKNPIQTQLEQLQNSLMTAEEAQIASFQRQQETLQAALEQQLITRQEYNQLMLDAQMQHSERMADISVYKYGDTLQQTGQFLGDMANALRNGNDKMLRFAKVFSAAEALVNSYRAYTQVIADPSLPWFAKIPAAVSVLGAGLGMVSAIKGVTQGAGGTAAAGGGNAIGAAGAAAPTTSRNVAISLTGGDMFSRDQVVSLINQINEAVEDGAVVRLV